MDRVTVDLSCYPDLVMMTLGMRVNTLSGLPTLFRFGPSISRAVQDKPDGLLCHETVIYSLFPPHLGIRQYWRDFESLEAWARTEPHKTWWKTFLKNPKGTGFWHEACFMKGGMEAVYVNVPERFGMRAFAREVPARGAMFSSRQRAGRASEKSVESVVPESELYKQG